MYIEKLKAEKAWALNITDAHQFAHSLYSMKLQAILLYLRTNDLTQSSASDIVHNNVQIKDIVIKSIKAKFLFSFTTPCDYNKNLMLHHSWLLHW